MIQNQAINNNAQGLVLANRKLARLYSHENKYGAVQGGFSIVELMITVAIVAILAAMATPSIYESIQSSKTKELSGEFTVALHLAQSEAIKRGIQTSIGSLNGDWQKGWNIFTDPNGNGLQDTGEELIQTYTFPPNRLTLVSKDSTFSSWLGFLPSGAAIGNGGISGGFRICRSDKDITKSRTVTVQASGNVIIETGTVSCP